MYNLALKTKLFKWMFFINTINFIKFIKINYMYKRYKREMHVNTNFSSLTTYFPEYA